MLRKNEHYSDPDPWTVISTVICAVSMVAQLAALAMQPKQASHHTLESPGQTAIDRLRDALHTAVHHVESLIRLFARAQSPGPLGNLFRFGETRMFLNYADFNEYKRLASEVALDVSHISSWTLILIQLDPNLASVLGWTMFGEVSDIKIEINSLHSERHTNEEVLETCLRLLRGFGKIIADLKPKMN